MARFSPTRLTLARHRRRLTQVQLAQLVGVSDRSIRAFEGGDDPAIADETIDRLSQVLGFPRAFFCAAELEAVGGVQLAIDISADGRRSRSDHRGGQHP